MEPLALTAAALLAAACVVFAALPFLRSRAASPDAYDDSRRERLGLLEQRDRALAALNELEFDHRTGKVADGDYRLLAGTLRAQAAEALRLLEPPQPTRVAELRRRPE
jgi:hypothetical protein